VLSSHFGSLQSPETESFVLRAKQSGVFDSWCPVSYTVSCMSSGADVAGAVRDGGGSRGRRAPAGGAAVPPGAAPNSLTNYTVPPQWLNHASPCHAMSSHHVRLACRAARRCSVEDRCMSYCPSPSDSCLLTVMHADGMGVCCPHSPRCKHVSLVPACEAAAVDVPPLLTHFSGVSLTARAHLFSCKAQASKPCFVQHLHEQLPLTLHLIPCRCWDFRRSRRPNAVGALCSSYAAGRRPSITKQPESTMAQLAKP
jgi:hypothetical protein